MHSEPIIKSLLQTDFYKFSMGNFIFEKFPKVHIESRFKNRTKYKKVQPILNYYQKEIQEQLDHVTTLKFKYDELNYLKSYQIFSDDYLNFLDELKLSEASFWMDDDGEPAMVTNGLWKNDVYWEIYKLPIINEIYAQHECLDIYCRMNGISIFDAMSNSIIQEECKAYFKEQTIKRLLPKIEKIKAHSGIRFFEFGTRRRSSTDNQLAVLTQLTQSFKNVPYNLNQFMGTSNVYFAKQLGLTAGGTLAHEMFMAYLAMQMPSDHARIVDNTPPQKYIDSQYELLRMWYDRFGWKYAVTLTDTYGSDVFFKHIPQDILEKYSFRHDSGDPFEYGEKVIKLLEANNVDAHNKVIVFSDGLNIDKIIQLYENFHERINVVFGWGSDLSCDVHDDFHNLSIVDKLYFVDEVCAVKLSDNLNKAIGEERTIEEVKAYFGYTNTFSEAVKY